METKIPKIIHYCWFGGKPLPKLAQRCKASWGKFFPDYVIKEWNESNFDVNALPYTRYCYEHRLWAYLSDYVRLANHAPEPPRQVRQEAGEEELRQGRTRSKDIPAQAVLLSPGSEGLHLV